MAEIWGTLLAYLSPSQTILFHTTALLIEDPLRRGVDTHVLLRNVYDWGVRSTVSHIVLISITYLTLPRFTRRDASKPSRSSIRSTDVTPSLTGSSSSLTVLCSLHCRSLLKDAEREH